MGLLDGLLGQVLSGALKPGQDDGRGLPDMGRRGGQGMGGLESILGGLAGGQPGAGQGKGGLESILGGLAGGAGTGAGPAMGAQGGGAALIAILLQMLQQRGGLGGLLSQFQQAGYGKQADSWVSTGENAPISGDVLSKVLGSGEIDRIAQQLGMSRGQAADQMASALPDVVNQMTPKGSVPGDSDDVVSRALEILQRGGR
jgi:uncharacterized protein YidB (DUF937 family)